MANKGKTEAQKFKPRPMKERNDHAIATFEHLYAKLMELNQFAATYPTISNLPTFRKEVFRWKGLNDRHIMLLENGMSEIMTENVEMEGREYLRDAEGNLKFKSEAHKADFEKGWAELMKTPCTIVL